ncbi:MAG: hypothetical protein K2N12_08015 [Helicobacter sp.]|nr:hypothetical protein [Helicobacter sp.]
MDTKKPTKKPTKAETESLLSEAQSSETNAEAETTPQEPKAIDTTNLEANFTTNQSERTCLICYLPFERFQKQIPKINEKIS